VDVTNIVKWREKKFEKREGRINLYPIFMEAVAKL
jgi:hypothetical protein